MSRLNMVGVCVAILWLIAGYCFWGKTGLGVAAVIITLVQMIP